MRRIGYDYSKPGLYFVTICSQNHICLFGKVEKNEMILNDADRMVKFWYYKLESKFQDIKCYDMVIMPNHFHCIIENRGVKNHQDSSSLTEVV